MPKHSHTRSRCAAGGESGSVPAEREERRQLRSRIMRAVRREKTDGELAVARYLREAGVHYRFNVRSLPGSPDLANKHRKFAVFVHGCFWHRHRGCKRTTTPKQNEAFWRRKFEQNVARDRRNEKLLRELGYEVVVVWECETRESHLLARALRPLVGTRKRLSGQ